ncbi:HlyD family secretion protein [Roseibium sp.]|uniref:HlyD family secretion protein n=1 Tax=Roseibium sp. TaxID=1936156 RepID=UPI003D145BDD
MADGTEDDEVKDARSGLARLRHLTLLAIGIAIVLFAYFVVADRTTPFAGDAQVQGFILRVAPEVNGHVASVAVIENQVVDEGDLLVQIDPTPFEFAVNQAEARLALAGQGVGASTAAVEAAAARLDEARATAANTRAQSERTLELVQRGIYAQARGDSALAAIEETNAAVQSAEADLSRARRELGPEGENNPQIQEALSALGRARYELSRTDITAPGRGVITNLQLTTGQAVLAGQQVMTFIGVEAVWLQAFLRENSLGVLAQGQEAEVVLDTRPGEVFRAKLQSVGWGVGNSNVDQSTGLPKSQPVNGWLSDPQRYPVQLVFKDGHVPEGARYGSRAAVIIYAGDNFFMNAIGWLRIRLISWLTYVS